MGCAAIASAQTDDRAMLTVFDAQFNGWVDEPHLDEISGIFALRNENNAGNLITCHDSDSEYMYVINSNGELVSSINLNNRSWHDVEEVTGYTDPDTNENFIILCEFGDNPATKDLKNLYRFVEPDIDSGEINIGFYDTIAYRLPEDVELEKGTNRGDFEGAFACPRDGKIYLFTKRMPQNYIFSLPIQEDYDGILTATFEGVMSSYVSAEEGGIISPANCVGAALSQDGNHALIKTYNRIYQFERNGDETLANTLINGMPSTIQSYVGLGPAPGQEPQGESVCFNNDDTYIFTVSEYRGNTRVPLFTYKIRGDVVTPPTPPGPKPLPVFDAKYTYDGDRDHQFTVTKGFKWTLLASTDLMDWEYVMGFRFSPTDNGDWTETHTLKRAGKQKEFFKFEVVSKDFAQYIADSTMNAIDGYDPTTDQEVFVDYMSATSHEDLVRNPNNFLHNKQGVTGLVAWNSRITGKFLGGVAITPRHVICCKHATYIPGDKLYFVTRSNEVIKRTVTHTEKSPYAADEGDFVVCLLNEDLPPSIEPMEMIVEDTYKYIDNDMKPIIDRDVKMVWVNKEEKSIVTKFHKFYMRSYEDDPFPYDYQQTGHAGFGHPFGYDIDEETKDWFIQAKGGDSGSVAMMVFEDKLVCAGLVTAGAIGVWFGQEVNMNDLDMMINIIDAKANVFTGYTIQHPDFSNFNLYK